MKFSRAFLEQMLPPIDTGVTPDEQLGNGRAGSHRGDGGGC